MIQLNIGRNIRHLRELNGFSQAYLAESISISQKALSRIETGFKSPTIEILQKICIELKVDLIQLIELSCVSIISTEHVVNPSIVQSKDLKQSVEREQVQLIEVVIICKRLLKDIELRLITIEKSVDY